jgi:GNAT superfamily N-acetyltransferase
MIIRRNVSSPLADAELRIKQWWDHRQKARDYADVEIQIERGPDPVAALSRARNLVRQDPESAAVLVPMELDQEEMTALGELDGEARIEVMSFRRGFDPPDPPSASLLEHRPWIAGSRTLEAVMDKMELGLRCKQAGLSFRAIGADEDDELEKYFRVRYEVYQPLGYIPPDFNLRIVRWELHWSDRWSIPFGLFTRAGDLIGCARLVSELGTGNQYATVIDRLVARKTKEFEAMMAEGEAERQILQHCSQPPLCMEHPFDLLSPFEKFANYYRVLVQNHVPKAEVSRVLILPQWRNRRFGEVLVDSLASEAAQRRFHLLFLACREEHGRFYRRSGFELVPGLKCDRFGNYPVAAIAMWRWLAQRPVALEGI